MIAFEELRRLVPAMADLPDETLKRLQESAVEKRYPIGAVLYRTGDAANGLYIILSGRVRVARETASRATMLHAEGRGGVLGELPTFGGRPFPATATASEPTTCMHIPIAATERLLRDDPIFARFALRRMAVRADSFLRRIDELTSTTIFARVAGFMLDRAAMSGPGPFTLGMSQQGLAEELGTAREVVVRALRAIINAGAVRRVGRSSYQVLRHGLLRALAHVDERPSQR